MNVASISNQFESCGNNRHGTIAINYVKRILRNFPTASERYYDIRVVPGKDRRSYFGEVGDQCLMFHSNRICLVTLAPSHPIISEKKKIEKIEYTFEGFEKIDRLACQPVGKSKKGGQKLQKNSPICAIYCSDGLKYIVTACIGSKLIEINTEISSKPHLLQEDTLSKGYVAIIQPNDWRRAENLRTSLPKLGHDLDISESVPREFSE